MQKCLPILVFNELVAKKVDVEDKRAKIPKGKEKIDNSCSC